MPTQNVMMWRVPSGVGDGEREQGHRKNSEESSEAKAAPQSRIGGLIAGSKALGHGKDSQMTLGPLQEPCQLPASANSAQCLPAKVATERCHLLGLLLSQQLCTNNKSNLYYL